MREFRGFFDEKWRIFVQRESSQKIRRIFAMSIVVVDANFRAKIRFDRQFVPKFRAKIHFDR